MAGVQELDRVLGKLREASDEIRRRRGLMETAGLVRGSRLTMPRLVVGVDGLEREFASARRHPSQERDEKLEECRALADTIARLGRATGVHLRLPLLLPRAVWAEILGRPVDEPTNGWPSVALEEPGT